MEQELRYITDGRRHLVCLPYSKANLHEMASRLGIKRCWFHRDHYDIPVRRMAEVESRCEIVPSRDIVRIIRGVYEGDRSGEDTVEVGDVPRSEAGEHGESQDYRPDPQESGEAREGA